MSTTVGSKGTLRHFLVIITTVLAVGAAFSACGGSDKPERTVEAGDTAAESTIVFEGEISRDALAKDSVSAQMREAAVYADYAKFLVQISKHEADSLAKAAMAQLKDPSRLREALQKGMDKLQAKKEAQVLEQLAAKYDMSVDSISAIVERWNGDSQ